MASLQLASAVEGPDDTYAWDARIRKLAACCRHANTAPVSFYGLRKVIITVGSSCHCDVGAAYRCSTPFLERWTGWRQRANTQLHARRRHAKLS